MTWMSSKYRRLLHRGSAAALLGPLGFSGCHHALQPDPVCAPPITLECNPLPLHNGSLTNDPAPGEVKTASVSAAPWEMENRPIDLPTALQLANAQNADIVVARERINEAIARQDLAELLWLPNLEIGSTWMRHDGQIQRANGEVFETSRSSLFVGGGPTLSLSVSEALFAPLAARQLTAARQAQARAVANDQILDVALAYMDLLQVHAELQINEETLRNAQDLLKLTENYEKVGKGAAADTARSRTEVQRRQRQRIEIQGRMAVVAARLTQLLQLPTAMQLKPVESAVVPIALVPEQLALAELVSYALASRPELAENRAIIEAVLQTWRAAKYAPWIPTLRLSYAAGGYGGGMNAFFGDFDGRGDLAATAVWQLQNFGLGNEAQVRERRSQYAQATFRQSSIEARVASQVVGAFSVAFARRQEMVVAQREIAAARESYKLNEERARRAPDQGRPIELLQAIQALAQARNDYLVVVSDYNRAQFRLYSSLGNGAACALKDAASIAITEPTVPSPDSIKEGGTSPKLDASTKKALGTDRDQKPADPKAKSEGKSAEPDAAKKKETPKE